MNGFLEGHFLSFWVFHMVESLKPLCGERIMLLRGNHDTTVSLSSVSDGLRSTISQVAAGRVSVSAWQYCNITIQTLSAKIVLLTNIIIIWLVAGCRLELETNLCEVLSFTIMEKGTMVNGHKTHCQLSVDLKLGW